MKAVLSPRLKLAIVVLLCLFVTAPAQKKTPPRLLDQVDDVVRIATELVQSDVTVVDKQNRFVDNLRADQFELRVDGKKQPIVFFERVSAGSAAEQKQLSAVSSKKVDAETGAEKPPPVPVERGRVIFFFVDDEHLTLENVTRSKQALLQFLDNEMQQNDLVAIVSPSGRVGFLQQLTTNKTVLREAVSRLSDQRKTETYSGKVPISDYDADQVAQSQNKELFRYLVEATAAEFQSDSLTAANMVRNRVAQIEAQSRATTSDTLMGLESLLKSSAPLPGRKILFFISGGFVTDPRASSVFERLQRITKAAAGVGAVIYTMDARGTFANIYTDASQNPYPDFTGTVSRNVFAEGQATQESLHTLAEDTGGRAFLGSNSFADGFRQGLTESSNYYLLAWRPASEPDRNGKTRFTVVVKDRPDLKVRLRRGFIELHRASSSVSDQPIEKPISPDAALLAALGSLYPVTGLPISLSAGYVNTAGKGPVLKAAMQIDLAALAEGSSKNELDVIGVALDDRGSIYSFKQKLSITPAEVAATGQQSVIWNQELLLRPGLYQVRVAARNRNTGQMGSAMQWLEIPAVAPSDSLGISSIFVGKRSKDELVADKVQINVTRRFDRSSLLRYQAFVYSGQPAEVRVQLTILREGLAVIALPDRQLSDADFTPAAALSGEIDLAKLSDGSYRLKILTTDKTTGRSVAQSIDFSINE